MQGRNLLTQYRQAASGLVELVFCRCTNDNTHWRSPIFTSTEASLSTSQRREAFQISLLWEVYYRQWIFHHPQKQNTLCKVCCINDYSQNYSCQHLDQIQSIYYEQTQASIHVTILHTIRHASSEIDG